MDDCAPRDAFAVFTAKVVVDGLRAEDACCADFVCQFADLVEDVGEDVFVVANCNDGLEDEFAIAGYCSAAGAVVGVFPADATVLFVDADTVFEWDWIAFVVCDGGRNI